jgi:hypothetical protein
MLVTASKYKIESVSLVGILETLTGSPLPEISIGKLGDGQNPVGAKHYRNNLQICRSL